MHWHCTQILGYISVFIYFLDYPILRTVNFLFFHTFLSGVHPVQFECILRAVQCVLTYCFVCNVEVHDINDVWPMHDIPTIHVHVALSSSVPHRHACWHSTPTLSRPVWRSQRSYCCWTVPIRWKRGRWSRPSRSCCSPYTTCQMTASSMWSPLAPVSSYLLKMNNYISPCNNSLPFQF